MSEQRIIHRTFSARDGTRIDAQEAGNLDGPAIVIVNGLGGNIYAWRALIEEFGDRYRIVSWDYRGLFRSGRPSDMTALTVTDHTDDLEAVLDHLRIDKALFVGWSIGVQLTLEAYARGPQRAAGMVLINGAPGRPFDGTELQATTVGRVLRFAARRGGLIQSGVELMRSAPAIIEIARRLKLVSPTLDRALFVELADEFADLDFEVYVRTLMEASQHDASEVLAQVKCPTLVVAGAGDPLTPRSTVDRLHTRIPDAELLVIPIGTHYVPIEFSEYLNLRVESFLDERVGPTW